MRAEARVGGVRVGVRVGVGGCGGGVRVRVLPLLRVAPAPTVPPTSRGGRTRAPTGGRGRRTTPRGAEIAVAGSEAESVARTAWLEGDNEEQALALAAFEDRIDDLADMTEHERQYGWVGELADSLGWREDVRYRVGLSEHINLKEARAFRTAIRRASADD